MGWEDIAAGLGGFIKDNFGSLLQGGISGYGYKQIMDDFGDIRDSLPSQLEGITGDVRDAAAFTPYGVRSGIGSLTYGPGGTMDYNLSGGQQAQMDQLGGLGQGFLTQAATMDPRMNALTKGALGASGTFRDRSLQDTGAREAEVYERMRALQRPDEQRQYSTMNANLFGGGRGGMTSGAYGGSPEQFAFGKAQAEARNQAAVQAMKQAQGEQMQQGQLAQMYGQQGMGAYGQGLSGQQTLAGMGQQALAGQYLPLQQLMGMAGQSIQQTGQQSQAGQGLAGLLAQLGIGGMTTDVNLAGVEGSAFGKLVEALAQAGGGLSA